MRRLTRAAPRVREAARCLHRGHLILRILDLCEVVRAHGRAAIGTVFPLQRRLLLLFCILLVLRMLSGLDCVVLAVHCHLVFLFLEMCLLLLLMLLE